MEPSSGLTEVNLSLTTMTLAFPRTLHSSGTVGGSLQVDADLTPSLRWKRLRLSSSSLTGTGQWETTDCYRNLGYICEITCWLDPEQPASGSAEDCGSAYMMYPHRYRGFQYRFETQKKTWQDAEDDCANQGTHLTSIHSLEEFDFILGEKLHHYLQLQH